MSKALLTDSFSCLGASHHLRSQSTTQISLHFPTQTQTLSSLYPSRPLLPRVLAAHCRKSHMKRGRYQAGREQVSSSSSAVQQAPSTNNLALPAGGIDIDGSMLEGGGQILRNAAALSACTGAPIRVRRIRAGRAKPGLRPQHVAGLQLVAAVCSGLLEGGAVGSCASALTPGRPRCGAYTSDTGTAGSCMLLAQAVLPTLLFASPAADAARGSSEASSSCTSTLVLRGGTDAAMAPPVGYTQQVLLPMLRRLLRVKVALQLQRRGFFPKGGGEVVLTAQSLPPGGCLPAFDLTCRGSLTSVSIQAFTAGSRRPDIAQRMASAAAATIKKAVGRSVEVTQDVKHLDNQSAFADGSGILLTAHTDEHCIFGASGLEERGTPAEGIGQNAATDLLGALATCACVDEWLQDQLVIFMALATGRSRLCCGPLTLHTRTAIAIAEQLTAAKFTVTQMSTMAGKEKPNASESRWLIECEGVGMTVK